MANTVTVAARESSRRSWRSRRRTRPQQWRRTSGAAARGTTARTARRTCPGRCVVPSGGVEERPQVEQDDRPDQHAQQGHRAHAHWRPSSSSKAAITARGIAIRRRCGARPSAVVGVVPRGDDRFEVLRLGVAVCGRRRSPAASRNATWLSSPASACGAPRARQSATVDELRPAVPIPRLGDRDPLPVIGDADDLGLPRARFREHLEGELLVR